MNHSCRIYLDVNYIGVRKGWTSTGTDDTRA
uniref:Uncharacterized protein n=1 Tax=Arundo donax TaxID=35708 RepID=A0A0A9FF92_ARUDO